MGEGDHGKAVARWSVADPKATGRGAGTGCDRLGRPLGTGMRRRKFIALSGAATAAVATFPRVSIAQQAKVPRVALVSGADPVTSMTATGGPEWAAFIPEL